MKLKKLIISEGLTVLPYISLPCAEWLHHCLFRVGNIPGNTFPGGTMENSRGKVPYSCEDGHGKWYASNLNKLDVRYGYSVPYSYSVKIYETLFGKDSK